MRQNLEDANSNDSPSTSGASDASFKIEFPGQQTGEIILYRAKMSPTMMFLTTVAVVSVAVVMLIMLQVMFSILLNSFSGVEMGSTVVMLITLLGIAITVFVLWWTKKIYDQTELIITDRRVVKFLPLVPYRTSSRALFWEEVIKVRTYYKNTILEKMLGIGSFGVNGRNHEGDNLEMDYLTFHEDLGNYVDKILYIYKNQPEELKTFKKFVPKPAGRRD